MSHTPSLSNPAERLATVFATIVATVQRTLARNPARLEGPVQMWLWRLIGQRFTQTRERFARLAPRLQAGWTYQPKPRGPRKQAAEKADRPPRAKNPLTSGSLWLFRAAPGNDTAAAAADLRSLLAEPEIAAVLAAAPVPAWRILRSVCWALGVEKPPVLARLNPPRPQKPPKLPKPAPPPPPWANALLPPPECGYEPAVPRYYWPRIPIRPRTG